jgi:ubiquinone/menaquinone biosynthesis C-methylase UbiE
MTEDFIDDKYYVKLAAAFVRGSDLIPDTDEFKVLKNSDQNSLEPDVVNKLIKCGLEKGIKIQNFKKNEQLPRVKKVLGIIKGLYPQNLLDIGSGRGVFLWPLVSQFPELDIISIEKNIRSVNDVNWVNRGGYERVKAFSMDASDISFPDNEFDIITALEVLEHMENYRKVLSELIRVSRRYLIISVPSKEDNNPDHIHLFTEKKLRESFDKYSIKKIAFQYVPGHMIAVITKG